MAMIEIKTNPSRRELRWFGLLFAVFFGLVGALIAFKFRLMDAAYIVWGSAGIITTLYYVVPPVRRPLYVGWMYAAAPIGWVMSHVLLALVYYGLLTPIGLLRRALRPDRLCRRFQPDAPTYWVEHRPGARGATRYFRQF